MKKLIVTALCVLFLSSLAYAAESTVTTSTSVTIQNIFSIEFFDDTSCRYADGQIAFPAVDPALGESMVNTSAWVNGDGKSDVGVVCITNISTDWYLKIRVDNMSAGFDKTNIAVYKPDQVYDRNTGTPYTTGITKEWYIMSDTDETIFGGSGGLQNTAPYGVLATFSYSVLPTGAADPSGQGSIGYGNVLPQGTYDFDIVYTLTTVM